MRAGEYSGDSGVHYVEADWNPLCPFGYGLTYTTFVCSDLQIEGGSLSACEVEEGGAGMRVLHCYEQRGLRARQECRAAGMCMMRRFWKAVSTTIYPGGD